jgi:hypothetical protein
VKHREFVWCTTTLDSLTYFTFISTNTNTTHRVDGTLCLRLTAMAQLRFCGPQEVAMLTALSISCRTAAWMLQLGPVLVEGTPVELPCIGLQGMDTWKRWNG